METRHARYLILTGRRQLSERSVAARPFSMANARLFSTSRGYATATEKLLQTPLYSLHVDQGAKMVPFGGYSMPLSYRSQVAEHKHTRKSASLFDVSHMVQSKIFGGSATKLLQYLTPSSIAVLPSTDENHFTSTLSVLLNEHGGIIDDLMITRQGKDSYYLVTNAARRDRDMSWISEQIAKWNSENGDRVQMEEMNGLGLIALQGPDASRVLQQHVSSRGYSLARLTFGKSAFIEIDGISCHVARGGYTGEDGFEISVPPESIVPLAESLLKHSEVAMAGLAARDSLRLEAGLCLYGHDLDEDTTPVEATLNWLIGKDRRSDGAFLGSETILRQLQDGPSKRRIGLIVEGAPAREGTKIMDHEGKEEIGIITSGIPSPTRNENIAMGYIKSGFHKRGTEVVVEIRKKNRNAKVAKMPFVEAQYFRG